MRIGIDARFYGGEQSKGLGRYTQKLLEYLLCLDNEHQYVVFVRDVAAQKKIKALSTKVAVVLAPYHWYSLAEQIFFPWLIYRAKVDLMHFPHFNVPLIYWRPFVVTIHDLIISRFPTERATTLAPVTYRLKQFAYHRVIAHAARRAKKIITVSEYSKQDMMDYFKLPAERIMVTYEAVDAFVETTKLTARDILKQYQITQPYLLYIGNAYPHKNLEIILNMMKELKQQNRLFFKMVFVGKEDYFYQRLKQQVWAMNLDKHTVFTGFIPDAELPSLYRSALAYIFPSKYEGFGLPPLEAMYYGTPVLSSQASCLPEILGDAALYFNFKDINVIIKHIFSLQSNITKTDLRQRLIAAGIKQVERYSWPALAKKTLQIYESIFTQS
ncbi:MAG: glycosyltransferase family 1 protein [Patescibacteria group bacterium]|jgi:glycosyltransferase involved in cell wall biosynthesis